jgi:hypothetical protein
MIFFFFGGLAGAMLSYLVCNRFELIPPVWWIFERIQGAAPIWAVEYAAFFYPALGFLVGGVVCSTVFREPGSPQSGKSTVPPGTTCQLEVFSLAPLWLWVQRKKLDWDRNAFCRGWLITGGTGVGKTESGINPIIHNLCQTETGVIRDSYVGSESEKAEREVIARMERETKELESKLEETSKLVTEAKTEVEKARNRMIAAEGLNQMEEMRSARAAMMEAEAKVEALDQQWGAIEEQMRTVNFATYGWMRKNELGKYSVAPWGGLAIDEKGSWYQILRGIFKHYKRMHHLCLIQTRPDWAKPGWRPESRFNLLGDDNTNADSYANIIVKTAQGVEGGGDGGGNSAYFITQAATHIGWAIKLDRAVRDHNRLTGNIPHAPDIINKPNEITEFPINDHLPNLRHCHKLLTDKTYLTSYLKYYKMRSECPVENYATAMPPDMDPAEWLEKTQEATRQMQGALNHLEKNYLGLAKDTWASVMGNIGNYLNYFIDENVAEVFCTDTTFEFKEVDRGMVVCVAMPQKLKKHRQYVCTILKLLFYNHALRRFDQRMDDRAGWNLLLCLQDEAQSFIQDIDGEVDKLRESQTTTIMATQTKGALKTGLGNKERAEIIISNLCSRFIFAPASIECAQESADWLGKVRKIKKSRSTSRQGPSYSYQEEFQYHIEPHEMKSKLPKFHAIVRHSDGEWTLGYIPPVTVNGELPHWVNTAVKKESLRVRWLVWLHSVFIAKRKQKPPRRKKL